MSIKSIADHKSPKLASILGFEAGKLLGRLGQVSRDLGTLRANADKSAGPSFKRAAVAACYEANELAVDIIDRVHGPRKKVTKAFLGDSKARLERLKEKLELLTEIAALEAIVAGADRRLAQRPAANDSGFGAGKHVLVH